METIERRFVDKGEWGEGPWQDEPDKIQYPDPETNLPCLIRRGVSGALCGYVGVAPEHPLHGKDYEEANRHVNVHGGLTYADACSGDEENGVCHVPGPGEPEEVWWFGFDCAHFDDVIPRYANDKAWEAAYGPEATYKTVAYVKAENARLAEALREAGS